MKASAKGREMSVQNDGEGETMISSGVQPLSELSDVGSIENRLVDFPFFFVLFRSECRISIVSQIPCRREREEKRNQKRIEIVLLDL